MPEPVLFLAFAVDEMFANALQRANPALVSLLTQGGNAYLESRQIHGQQHLGKQLSSPTDLDRILAVEKNIHSLTQRLAPDIPVPALTLLTMSSHD